MEIPSRLIAWNTVLNKLALSFIKCFSCIYWNVFCFIVLKWYTILRIFKNSLNPLWTLVMIYYLFTHYQILLVNIFFRIFVCIFMIEINLIFLFCYFSGFNTKFILGLQNELGAISYFYCLEIWINLGFISLKFGRNCQ